MTTFAQREYHRTHPSVTIEEIDRQRSLGWIDFHPEDYCHRCGGKNPTSWFVDSDRWNIAFPDGDAPFNGIVCPGCFVMLHEIHTGMWTTWRLVNDGIFRHVEDE